MHERRGRKRLREEEEDRDIYIERGSKELGVKEIEKGTQIHEEVGL